MAATPPTTARLGPALAYSSNRRLLSKSKEATAASARLVVTEDRRLASPNPERPGDTLGVEPSWTFP